MKHKLRIRIMAAGRYFDCWQVVGSDATSEATVLGYVDDAGEPVTLPDPHEAMILDATPVPK